MMLRTRASQLSTIQIPRRVTQTGRTRSDSDRTKRCCTTLLKSQGWDYAVSGRRAISLRPPANLSVKPLRRQSTRFHERRRRFAAARLDNHKDRHMNFCEQCGTPLSTEAAFCGSRVNLPVRVLAETLISEFICRASGTACINWPPPTCFLTSRPTAKPACYPGGVHVSDS
jgi:hypothetical protein